MRGSASGILFGTTVKGEHFLCFRAVLLCMLIEIRGEVQNFVGIHPSHPGDDQKGGMSITSNMSFVGKEKLKRSFSCLDCRNSMLQEFGHYHPNVGGILQ